MNYPVKIVPIDNKNIITVLATINNNCNFNCYYCYNSKPRSNKILDLDKLYYFLLEINKQTNKKICLHLLGGEPSLHIQLKNFIRKINFLQFITVIIYTNFHLKNDFFKELIYKNVIFNITYHYYENLEQFILKINDFLIYKAKVDLTLMYELNLSDSIIEVFYKLKTNSNINSLQILLIMDNLKNKKIYNYSNKLLELYQKIVNEDIKTNIFNIFYNDGSIKLMSFYDTQNIPNFSILFWKCWAGIDYLEIDLNGNVYPCMQNSEKIFNINESLYSFKMPNIPIICKKKYCNISYLPIMKEKIFKNINK